MSKLISITIDASRTPLEILRLEAATKRPTVNNKYSASATGIGSNPAIGDVFGEAAYNVPNSRTSVN